MIIKDKVFLITGASSGIGKELALQLSKRGALLSCAARSMERLEDVCEKINRDSGTAIPIQTDITDYDQCRKMVKNTIKSYGRIDSLIINAGISMWARFDEIHDINFFKDIINTNYLGAVYCVHAALPHLKVSAGKVVSCSTAQALMGFPNHSGYVASKHALHGFLSTLRMENKSEISVLEAVLSWIRGTNLRENSFMSSGSTHGASTRKHTRESISLDVCVQTIIKAIEEERSVVYIPKKLRLIPFLKVFFKSFLEKKVMRAINKNTK